MLRNTIFSPDGTLFKKMASCIFTLLLPEAKQQNPSHLPVPNKEDCHTLFCEKKQQAQEEWDSQRSEESANLGFKTRNSSQVHGKRKKLKS